MFAGLTSSSPSYKSPWSKYWWSSWWTLTPDLSSMFRSGWNRTTLRLLWWVEGRASGSTNKNIAFSEIIIGSNFLSSIIRVVILFQLTAVWTKTFESTTTFFLYRPTSPNNFMTFQLNQLQQLLYTRQTRR